MGRITTPTYRVEAKINGQPYTQAWTGRATKERLEDWRKAMNRSFQPGGANAHLSTEVVQHMSFARIVHQASGAEVCRTSMPTFEVV